MNEQTHKVKEEREYSDKKSFERNYNLKLNSEINVAFIGMFASVFRTNVCCLACDTTLPIAL